jgi:hypothetical protein
LWDRLSSAWESVNSEAHVLSDSEGLKWGFSFNVSKPGSATKPICFSHIISEAHRTSYITPLLAEIAEKLVKTTRFVTRILPTMSLSSIQASLILVIYVIFIAGKAGERPVGMGKN